MLRYSFKKPSNVVIDNAFILRNETGILFDNKNSEKEMNPYSHPDLYVKINKGSNFESFRERYKVVFGNDVETDMPEIINAKKIVLTNEALVLLELEDSTIIIYDPYDSTENPAVTYVTENRTNFVIAPFISADSEEKILQNRIESYFRYNKYTSFQPVTVLGTLEEDNSIRETIRGFLDEDEKDIANMNFFKLVAHPKAIFAKEYSVMNKTTGEKTVTINYFLERFLDSSKKYALGEGESLTEGQTFINNGLEGYDSSVAESFANLSTFAVDAKAEIAARIASSDIDIPSDGKLIILRKNIDGEISRTQSIKTFELVTTPSENFSKSEDLSEDSVKNTREIGGYNFNFEFVTEGQFNSPKEYLEIYLATAKETFSDGLSGSRDSSREPYITVEVR